MAGIEHSGKDGTTSASCLASSEPRVAVRADRGGWDGPSGAVRIPGMTSGFETLHGAVDHLLAKLNCQPEFSGAIGKTGLTFELVRGARTRKMLLPPALGRALLPPSSTLKCPFLALPSAGAS